MNTKGIKLTETQFREMIAKCVNDTISEARNHFMDLYNRSKESHSSHNRQYGFELRKNGKWHYGDIEYDPNTQQMSCMGIPIHVSPNMTILDAEEDLYEALLDAGYETDF